MLNERYPISSWVTARDQLSPGDKVTYYCSLRQEEVVAVYLGFPDEGKDTLILCQVEGIETAELVDHWDTVIYKIEPVHECSCGAKYTNMPTVHLRYCDMFKVEGFWKNKEKNR